MRCWLCGHWATHYFCQKCGILMAFVATTTIMLLISTQAGNPDVWYEMAWLWTSIVILSVLIYGGFL